MFLALQTAAGGRVTLNLDLIASIRSQGDGGCGVVLANGNSIELDASEGARLTAAIGIEAEAGDGDIVDLQE